MENIKFIYKLIPFAILAFIIFACSSTSTLMEYKNQQIRIIAEHNLIVDKCKKIDINNVAKEEKEYCDKMIAMDISEYDMNAYTAYDIYVVDFLRKYLIEYIVILILTMLSSYYVTKYLRNRIILNDINRNSYKAIVKKLFFSSWIYSLLLPLMLIIIIFIIFCFVGVNGFRIGLYGLKGTIFEKSILLYFFVIIIQSFVLSLIYININLIVARKEHNYILAIIKSYIVIIGLEIFFETILSGLFYKLFDSNLGKYFNILTIYNYLNYENKFNGLFVHIAVLIVSFILVFLCYKNKEKLIVDSEKNNNKEED